MTAHVPGYATPNLIKHNGIWYAEASWQIAGQPYSEYVGQVEQHEAGWTAHTPRRLYVGLFPDKQAAAEALVKKAGYELLV